MKKSIYSDLRSRGLLAGTIASCERKREERIAANPPGTICHGRFAGRAKIRRARRGVPTVVPLGRVDILSRAKAQQPRLREWSLGQEPAVQDESWTEITVGSNSCLSRRSTFRRGITVQSYATCTDFRLAVLRLAGEVHQIKAPRGWRWDISSNRLRLRSCSDARIDYHPTASELIGDVAGLPRLARAGWATRQAAAVRAKKADAAAVKRAEAVGVMVCLADSLRAGNCRDGTEKFAKINDFDPARHYTPAEVLAVANGQTRFVAMACTAALRRTIRELADGQSVLADHRVS